MAGRILCLYLLRLMILVDDNSSVENSQLVNNEADISKLKDRYKQSKAV